MYYSELPLSLGETQFKSLLNCLPEHWHPSVLKYLREEDRILSAAAKWLLYLGLQKHKFPVNVVFENGRPVTESDSVGVSVSHTPGFVACAINDAGAVGIDVERIRPVVPADFKSVLTSGELVLLEGNPLQSDTRFFDIWTRKESIAKACGRGMYVNFASFAAHDSMVIAEGNSWTTSALHAPDRYAAAVGYPADAKVSLYWINQQISV